MRLRTVVVVGLAGAAAAVAVARRRRGGAPPPSPGRIGRADGTVVRLEAGDPRLADLRVRAADLRRALEAVG